MKRQYDFSKAERGKFFRSDAVFHIPIYHDPDVENALQSIAEDTGENIGTLVNNWLRNNLSIIQSAQPPVNP